MNSANDNSESKPTAQTAELAKYHSVGMAVETPYRVLRSSKADFIAEVERMHDEWLKAQADPIRRLWENFRMYMPVDGSAWDDEAYSKLRAENRHPVSIDISSRKIDALAGSMLAEKWDFDFKPVAGEGDTLSQGIKSWYFADKEQFNYSQGESKALVGGLLHSACEEIGIDRDVRRSGAISFWCNGPGVVLKDPYWQSDIHRDWKRAIKRAYFTAQEMRDKWDVNDAFVEERARTDKSGGDTYGTVSNVDVFMDSPKTWGSKYLTLEYRWLERKRTTRLWARVGQPPYDEWIPLPSNAKSREEVQALMAVYGIASYEDLKEMPDFDEKLKLMICAPGLTRISTFYEGDHDVQCGSIGFFWFSACHWMGVDKGIMDAMKDVQRTLNYRESKKDDIIAHMAANPLGVDVQRLDEEYNSYADVKQNITKPGYTIATKGNPDAVIRPIQRSEVPASIMTDLSSFIQLFNQVSPVTPALQGTGERDESGVLYEMRHAVTKLGTLILYGNWRQHLENKAEAWYYQAQKTYAGLYRRIKDVESGDWLEFNSPDYVGQQKVYRNNVQMLPRALVIVTLRKDSPTESLAVRSMLYDVTKILSAHPELFKNEIRVLTNQIVKTIEMLPEEKRKLDMLGQMQEVADVLEIMTKIESLKATGLQAQVIQQQAMGMLRQIAGQMGMGPNGQPGQPPVPEAVSPERPGVPPPSEELTPEQEYTQIPTETMGIGKAGP
jgi:hypothetical protein